MCVLRWDHRVSTCTCMHSESSLNHQSLNLTLFHCRTRVDNCLPADSSLAMYCSAYLKNTIVLNWVIKNKMWNTNNTDHTRTWWKYIHIFEFFSPLPISFSHQNVQNFITDEQLQPTKLWFNVSRFCILRLTSEWGGIQLVVLPAPCIASLVSIGKVILHKSSLQISCPI